METRQDRIHEAANRALDRVPVIMLVGLLVGASWGVLLWFFFGNSPWLLLALAPMIVFLLIAGRWSLAKQRREMHAACAQEEKPCK